MKVRDEIEKHAAEADKPALRWVFERYHMESEWRVMAYCEFVGKYPNSHRVWKLKPAGQQIYEHAKMKKALQFYADEQNWKDVETGIGMHPGPAIDYGATAREALT